MIRSLLAHLLLIGTIFGTSPAVASEPEEPVEVLIFLVDCSGSMKGLPEPDTTQAAITEALQVAILSGRKVKFAVVLLNGNGVKVLGDENDMPTSALKTLHNRVLNEWEQPFGGTPLDEALQNCFRMVKNLSPDDRVTVVTITDGQPCSGRLRPDDFGEIRERMDQQLKAIRALAYPPTITQQLVDARELAWKKPSTEEYQELLHLQMKAEFAACLRHAAVLKGRKVRFVTLDFGVQVDELRQIHEAAGGVHDDYTVVQPANNVVKCVHALGLTRLQGIITPAPVALPADTNSFERETRLPLDPVGEAALVTLVFHTPIPRFEQQVELAVDAGGVTYAFSEENTDPNAVLSLDAAGNVASATLVLPSLDGIRDLNIRYRSPSFALSPPETTIFIHLRVSANLLVVARPQHRGSDDMPPFSLPTQRGVDWVFGLRFKDDPNFLPLRGVEPVWRHQRDGSELRLDTEPDAGSPGAFRSASPLTFPPGFYDLAVNYILESGAQIRLRLTGHVRAQQADEHVTIEYDRSSKSDTCLDLGEIGDDVREGTVAITVRTANIEYPVPIALSVVGLSDAQGNTPQETWIQPTQPKIQTFPGRAHKATLRWKLPDQIEQTLVDGTYNAELQVRRLDTDAILDVRPYDTNLEDALQQINQVRFVLHRPQLKATAPRGSRDALVSHDKDSRQLPLKIDVAVPFGRTVRIRVENHSALPRKITSNLLTPFRDPEGRNIRGIELTLHESCEATQLADPHDAVTFTYRLKVDDLDELRSGTARLTLTSPGVHGVEITVETQIRQPLMGPWIRSALFLFSAIALLLVCAALYTHLRAKPHCTEKEFVCTTAKPIRQFAVQRASKGRVRITSNEPLTVKRPDDDRERPVNGQLRLGPDDASPADPLFIAEQRAEGQRTIVAVTDILTDEDGEPELHGHVVEGGRFDRLSEFSIRRMVRRGLAAAMFFTAGVFLFKPPVLGAAQWVCDFVSL